MLSFVIPLTLELSGAAGAGGGSGNDLLYNVGGDGGDGNLINTSIITAGTTLTIVVGGGGAQNNSAGGLSGADGWVVISWQHYTGVGRYSFVDDFNPQNLIDMGGMIIFTTEGR